MGNTHEGVVMEYGFQTITCKITASIIGVNRIQSFKGLNFVYKDPLEMNEDMTP